MYSICLRYQNDVSSANEALQRGFIKVFENLHKYKDQGNLGGWIKTIIVRTCIDMIKEQKKIRFEDIDQIREMASKESEHYQDFSHIDYKALLTLLEQLPLGYRTVFSMYVLDEMKHEEIAKTLKITVGTSRSQLSKARKMLQELVKKNYMNLPFKKCYL